MNAWKSGTPKNKETLITRLICRSIGQHRPYGTRRFTLAGAMLLIVPQVFATNEAPLEPLLPKTPITVPTPGEHSNYDFLRDLPDWKHDKSSINRRNEPVLFGRLIC